MPRHEVMQFKVTLLDIHPPVWRRIEVPASYTFWDLHVAIQDSMGWKDSHLHQFKLGSGRRGGVVIGIPDEEFEAGRQTLPGWRVPVRRYLAKVGDKARYEYDFGDGWEHEVRLEKVLPHEEGAEYPRCLAGARACPPEDSGGPLGYGRLLEALRDSTHPSHAELLEWVGGPFDAEAFDPARVGFDDPQERWELAFEE